MRKRSHLALQVCRSRRTLGGKRLTVQARTVGPSDADVHELARLRRTAIGLHLGETGCAAQATALHQQFRLATDLRIEVRGERRAPLLTQPRGALLDGGAGDLWHAV